MNYDAGPGQIMINEPKLYPFLIGGYKLTPKTIIEKIKECMAIMIDGFNRHIKKKEKQISNFKKNFGKYVSVDNIIIDQTSMTFGV
jgi:hypothetical protein